ncbi:MAG: LysE family translocator [Halobacteria archaeon]
MTHVSTFIVGALMGFSLTIPLGPVNVLVADISVTDGWLKGLKSGSGAIISNILFAILSITGAVYVIDVTKIHGIIAGVGGIFMFYMAYSTYKSYKTPDESELKTDSPVVSGFLMSATNPFGWMWWMTVGLTMMEPRHITMEFIEFHTSGGYIILVGFFTAAVSWYLFFSVFVDKMNSHVSNLEKIVTYVSILILVLFGAEFIDLATEMV